MGILTRLHTILRVIGGWLIGVGRLGWLLILFGLFDYLFRWGILALFWNYVWGRLINPTLSQLREELTRSPIISLLALLALTGFFAWFLRLRGRLNIVAGEFKDDFGEGLYKWEFGGEGWKIEREDGNPILSVSESPDGGITKKGFAWSDYEFSFDTKIINNNVGWIVRAEHRNKYMMIQFHMEDVKEPKLRFHLRLPPSPRRTYQWIVTQVDKLSLKRSLKPYEWIKVRIVVLGSNIDVFINDEHAAHYFIADPIRWEEEFSFPGGEGRIPKTGTYITTINYSAGRVGFRCAAPEHAHFRNVRVKPLEWG